MKRTILFAISSIIALSLYAKDVPESSVPANVKAYITQHYPEVKNIDWEYKKKQNYYEAEFYIDGREIELEIEASGSLRYSKEDMLIKDIPSFATSYISKNYPEAEILGANKKVQGNSVSYSVGIAFINKNGYTRHQNIVFDKNGNVIKK